MFTNNLKIRKALIGEKPKIRKFILNHFYKKKHILALNEKLFLVGNILTNLYLAAYNL